MPESQTIWSGVFAALHPQHIYQHNLQALDAWMCALLALTPTHQDLIFDNHDLQVWYHALMQALRQDPHQFCQHYAAVNTQFADPQWSERQVTTNKVAILALKQHIEQKRQQLIQLQDVVPDLALQLQHISRQAWLDRRQQEQEQQDLHEETERLQQDIRSFQASMTALGLMGGLALIFGAVTTGALWPFGSLVWVVLLPTVLMLLTLWLGDWRKWRDDQHMLRHQQQQIAQLDRQISQQHATLEQYHTWLAQTTAMQQRVGQILAAWHTLESDVGMTLAQLCSVEVEWSRAHPQAAVQHWEDAQLEWRAAYEQIEALCAIALSPTSQSPVISCDHVLMPATPANTQSYQQP